MTETYISICSKIPENGISLDGLKTLIMMETGYHREETLVHHIKVMEMLGYLVRKDLTFFSKWRYPKKDEIKPITQANIETMDEAEKEVDEFLSKF
ncbi:MAG: hypothetical protein QXY62_05930 [Candidatus Altiarchaeota archaeon]